MFLVKVGELGGVFFQVEGGFVDRSHELLVIFSCCVGMCLDVGSDGVKVGILLIEVVL